MTAAWMSGYVGDVAYTLGFYRELAPSYLHHVCIASGVEGLPDRKLRYAELGCGRGYGTTLLAAANPDYEFVGLDFNPTHIAEARALARRAGITNVAFMEMSFSDAARSHDPQLADLDVIAMHGVYSWIEPKIREDIHEFIRRKLIPGGLVYVSYNTLPGWAPVIPVQRILKETADRATGDSVAQVKKGLQLLKTLVEKSSAFVVQNPALKTRLGKMAEQDERYLAHEFLNRGWQPLFVTEAMSMLSEAKLTYVGSAAFAENRLDMCVPKELRELVTSAPDPAMRELLKDYVINKQFRRDIYVKGPQRLSPREQRQRYGALSLAATFSGKDLPEKIRIPIGEVKPKKEVVEAMLGRLKDKRATADELIAAATKAGSSDANAWIMIEMLIGAALLSPARSQAGKVDRGASRRLNDAVMETTLSADTHRFLASPVLGSAIPANFVDRIVAPIVAKDGRADDLKIAAQAFERLERSGQKLVRQGKPMERNDENLREVAKFVREFRDYRLPRWRALEVVE